MSKTFSRKMGVHFNDLGNYKLWQSAKGVVFVALKHLGIGREWGGLGKVTNNGVMPFR